MGLVAEGDECNSVGSVTAAALKTSAIFLNADSADWADWADGSGCSRDSGTKNVPVLRGRNRLPTLFHLSPSGTFFTSFFLFQPDKIRQREVAGHLHGLRLVTIESRYDPERIDVTGNDVVELEKSERAGRGHSYDILRTRHRHSGISQAPGAVRSQDAARHGVKRYRCRTGGSETAAVLECVSGRRSPGDVLADSSVKHKRPAHRLPTNVSDHALFDEEGAARLAQNAADTKNSDNETRDENCYFFHGLRCLYFLDWQTFARRLCKQTSVFRASISDS